MKTVALTLVVDSYPDTTIKICPSGGFAVACYASGGKVADDRCEVFTPYGTFTIRGTVDEVSAALESAAAPPIAAAVEVAPTDLEIAAKVLEEVAGAIGDDGDRLDSLSNRIHNTIGSRYDLTRWDGSIARLQALAAKLRGGG